MEHYERCEKCPYKDMDRHLEYYNYPYCRKNGREISYCEKYGWHKMNWCPLDKESDKKD